MTALVIILLLSTLYPPDGGVAQQQTSRVINMAAKAKRNYFAHLKPEHRAVLKAWLKGKPYLRPATEEADSVYKDNRTAISESIGKRANQYYSVGDFNGDGKEDFAVLLADRRYAEDGFALAVFNGKFSRGRAPAYYEEKFDYISNSYVVFDGAMKRRLFLGVFEGDWYCMTLIPKRKGGYTYQDCNR
jgi:hypothetical protein